jgi:hypothetical protein
MEGAPNGIAPLREADVETCTRVSEFITWTHHNAAQPTGGRANHERREL